MFTIELQSNTVEDLRKELEAKGLTLDEIDRFIKDTGAIDGISSFSGTERPIKALAITTHGKQALVLGIRLDVDKDGGLSSVSFPAGDAIPFLLLSKGHTDSNPDKEDLFNYIKDFTPWNFDPKSRLLVLTGANGSGKTHLLRYIYESLAGDYNDEVFFSEEDDH